MIDADVVGEWRAEVVEWGSGLRRVAKIGWVRASGTESKGESVRVRV